MDNKTQNFQGKDTFERMNFLYQAGHLMSGTNSVLSCYYGQLCKSVAKKAVLRMEPNIKRTICKRCGNILRPGTSADCSMDPSNLTVCRIECGKCKFIKRFTINSKYKLWLDSPDAITTTISAQPSRKTVQETVTVPKNPPNLYPITRSDEPLILEKKLSRLCPTEIRSDKSLVLERSNKKLSIVLSKTNEMCVQTENKSND